MVAGKSAYSYHGYTPSVLYIHLLFTDCLQFSSVTLMV